MHKKAIYYAGKRRTARAKSLSRIVRERLYYRKKIIKARQPLERPRIDISEMASKCPESLIAIAELPDAAIDRNAYRQLILQIRDINLLCLLKVSISENLVAEYG